MIMAALCRGGDRFYGLLPCLLLLILCLFSEPGHSFLHQRSFTHSRIPSTRLAPESQLFLARNVSSSDWIEDATSTIVPDILGIVVAFEFLGIVDDMNAPDFIQKGGWIAPIRVEDLSAVPILIERISTNSVFWLLALLSTNKALFTFGIYCIIHCLADLLTNGNSLEDLEKVLLECYFSGIFIWASRYFLVGRI